MPASGMFLWLQRGQLIPQCGGGFARLFQGPVYGRQTGLDHRVQGTATPQGGPQGGQVGLQVF